MKQKLSPIIVSIFFFSVSCEKNKDFDINWISNLDQDVRDSILWFCDYESKSFEKWEDAGTDDYYAGGGIFLTDTTNVNYGIEEQIVHSGNYSSYASIHNAITPGQNKAVRFMRWTDKAWNKGGDYFPEEAYYSVFMYFPENYNPAKSAENDPNNDGGWWNVFQFKSDNHAGSMPVVVLDLYNQNNNMFFGLVVKDYPNDASDIHSQEYMTQPNPQEIQPGRWIHIEMFLKKSKEYDGKVIVWQNGTEIVRKENIRTVLPPGETATWGIGNYTDYIVSDKSQGSATVYFDDAIISRVKISDYLF